MEIDELIVMDIFASYNGRGIDFPLLKEMAEECFMPLSYGGNINSLNDARNIFEIGFEKIIINSNAYKNLNLIESIANEFGSQCLIGSIDVKKNFLVSKFCFIFV